MEVLQLEDNSSKQAFSHLAIHAHSSSSAIIQAAVSFHALAYLSSIVPLWRIPRSISWHSPMSPAALGRVD